MWVFSSLDSRSRSSLLFLLPFPHSPQPIVVSFFLSHSRVFLLSVTSHAPPPPLLILQPPAVFGARDHRFCGRFRWRSCQDESLVWGWVWWCGVLAAYRFSVQLGLVAWLGGVTLCWLGVTRHAGCFDLLAFCLKGFLFSSVCWWVFCFLLCSVFMVLGVSWVFFSCFLGCMWVYFWVSLSYWCDALCDL